jgi:MSHA biogenesis protein MshI
VKIRWPFKKLSYQYWLGINLSELNPSAVIYSAGKIKAAKSFSQDEGLEALAQWLKKHATEAMPAVLVLDEKDYELLLTEAPDVPDEELNAAMEFRIADLLPRGVAETAIQTMRLPADAYRGRMSMAHVIAASNDAIEGWVKWSEKLNLNLSLITVPELCLLNLLALFEIEQGIGLLELGPKQGCLRLYQGGALYLTRQVEVGLDALELVMETSSDEDEVDLENSELPILELDSSVTEESGIDLNMELSDEADLEDEGELVIEEYVPFAGKEKVNSQQLQNLMLEVQRSLDYYESQLGMGQINRLWLMSGDEDLSDLVTEMNDQLSAKIEQPDISKMLEQIDFHINSHNQKINSAAVALGGALAYVGS